MQIKGTVSIVTGGASGLGLATAKTLINQGGKVALFDLTDEEKGQKMASDLGSDAIFCHVDVSDEQSVKNAIAEVLEKLGAIYGVVNCAGIGTPMKLLGKDGPMPLNVFNKVIQVNLTGTVNVIRLAVKEMVNNTPNDDGERGVIVNTASVAAFEGQIGQVAYSASKGGIVAITLPLARELARYGIRVMTIAPGLFETPMLAGLPEKAKASLARGLPFPSRFGKPAEYAHLVKAVFENPILNGETIRIDSALRMQPK